MKCAVFSLAALLLTLVQISVFAQVSAVPQLMNFQGKLAKPDGTPDCQWQLRNPRSSSGMSVTGGTATKRSGTRPSIRHRGANGTFAAVLLNVASPVNLFDANLWLEVKIGSCRAAHTSSTGGESWRLL